MSTAAMAQEEHKAPGEDQTERAVKVSSSDALPRSDEPTLSLSVVGEGPFDRGYFRLLVRNNDPRLWLCIVELVLVAPPNFRKRAYFFPEFSGRLADLPYTRVTSDNTPRRYCIGPLSQYPLTTPAVHEDKREHGLAEYVGLDDWFFRYGSKEQIDAWLRYEMYTYEAASGSTLKPPVGTANAEAKDASTYEVTPSRPDPPGGAARAGTANAKAEYEYHTPIIALLIGALVGCFLSGCVAIIRAKGTRRRELGSSLIAALGSVTIVLALKFGAAIDLPITLSVNDFYGAVIVGLLSRRLTTPLFDWLGLKQPEREGHAG